MLNGTGILIIITKEQSVWWPACMQTYMFPYLRPHTCRLPVWLRIRTMAHQSRYENCVKYTKHLLDGTRRFKVCLHLTISVAI